MVHRLRLCHGRSCAGAGLGRAVPAPLTFAAIRRVEMMLSGLACLLSAGVVAGARHRIVAARKVPG